MRRSRWFGAALLAGVASMALAGPFGVGPNSTIIPSTGQNLSILISQPPNNTLVPIPPGTIEVKGNCAIGSVPGQPINVLYIVDVSGSTDNPGTVDANGDGFINAADDFNGDGEAGEILDGEIAGVLALNASLGNPANVRVGVVAFATGASAADASPLAPNTGVITQFYTTPPQADVNGILGPDINEVLRSLRSETPTGGTIGKFTPVGSGVLGNTTSFMAALAAMNPALANFPSGTNLVFFLSDGASNTNVCHLSPFPCNSLLNTAVAAGTTITTIGVGAGADPVDLTYIATYPGIGGIYVPAPNPSLLSTLLPSINPAGINTVKVDGVDVGIDALGNFSKIVSCQNLAPFTVTATCFASDPATTTVSADVDLQCYTLCGDGQVGSGEECDPPNTPTCDANCQRVPVCGDGLTDAPEQCDPPNNVSCSATCQFISCGDGLVQGQEECEPPNTATCDASCQRVPSCGDGFVDAPELCEPPNTAICFSDCTPIACGNDRIEPGEECEPSNPVPPCAANCQRIPVCGDGFLDGSEACDPPNNTTCNNSCQPIVCGDGVAQGTEECDGSDFGSSTCTPSSCQCAPDCTRIPVCGDGQLDGSEQCDPPASPGCDASCTLIACGNSIIQPGEECDPPDTNLCDDSCQRVPQCGDNLVDAPETCDPPNGTTCDLDCTEIACGNADVEPGEECDPPNGTTCSATCQRIPNCGDGFIDSPEQCEPPNSPNCNANCRLIACGNGDVDPGEECDPPNTATCDPNCQRVPICGDGLLDNPEQCEPPNTTTCGATCALKEICTDLIDNDGDGLIDCKDTPECPPCPPPDKDPSKIKFGKVPGKDIFQTHGRMPFTSPINPATEGFGVVLTNKDQAVIYRTMVAGPQLLAAGTGFKFKDKSGLLADNLVMLKLVNKGTFIAYKVKVIADLSLARGGDPEMTIQVHVGDDAFSLTRQWTQKPNGWLLRND